MGRRRPDGPAMPRSEWEELSRCLQGWEMAKKRQAWDPPLWREDLVIVRLQGVRGEEVRAGRMEEWSWGVARE